MSDQALFIGGPADGQIRHTHGFPQRIQVQVPAPMGPIDYTESIDFAAVRSFQGTTYERHYMQFGGRMEELTTVYVPAGAPMRETMEAMFLRYSQMSGVIRDPMDRDIYDMVRHDMNAAFRESSDLRAQLEAVTAERDELALKLR